MHACAALLTEVENLLTREENALAQEDIDLMAELFESRAALLDKAWQERLGYDEAALRKRLLLIQARQGALEVNAQSLYERLRETLQTGRKQTQYFAGYRTQVDRSNKANYVSKVS